MILDGRLHVSSSVRSHHCWQILLSFYYTSSWWLFAHCHETLNSPPNASDRIQSCGLPVLLRFSSCLSSLLSIFCSICLSDLKLLLHSVWYTASTANRSCAYSILALTVSDQLSVWVSHISLIVTWKTCVLTGFSLCDVTLPLYLSDCPQNTQLVLYWKVTPEKRLVVCLDPEVDSVRLLFLRSRSIFILSQYILRQFSLTNCFSTTSISSCLSLLASSILLRPFRVNWIVFLVAINLLQNT